jgi:hypothetical protein
LFLLEQYSLFSIILKVRSASRSIIRLEKRHRQTLFSSLHGFLGITKQQLVTLHFLIYIYIERERERERDRSLDRFYGFAYLKGHEVLKDPSRDLLYLDMVLLLPPLLMGFP